MNFAPLRNAFEKVAQPMRPVINKLSHPLVIAFSCAAGGLAASMFIAIPGTGGFPVLAIAGSIGGMLAGRAMVKRKYGEDPFKKEQFYTPTKLERIKNVFNGLVHLRSTIANKFERGSFMRVKFNYFVRKDAPRIAAGIAVHYIAMFTMMQFAPEPIASFAPLLGFAPGIATYVAYPKMAQKVQKLYHRLNDSKLGNTVRRVKGAVLKPRAA